MPGRPFPRPVLQRTDTRAFLSKVRIGHRNRKTIAGRIGVGLSQDISATGSTFIRLDQPSTHPAAAGSAKTKTGGTLIDRVVLEIPSLIACTHLSPASRAIAKPKKYRQPRE